MVTRDVDFVVAVDEIEPAVATLEAVGFVAQRHPWSVNFLGRSQVSLRLSTEDFYREFPARSVPADVHLIQIKAFDVPPQEKQLVIDTRGIVWLGERLAQAYLTAS